MNAHELYMTRCFELAKMGLGRVAPNPMVGCVIVHENKIIGEGYHQKFGEAHAEVNAVQAVLRNGNLPALNKSKLYVNLEPCAHFGKTPPCTSLILQYKIPEVVIGCTDTHALVSGKGIGLLENNGVKVIPGILSKEARYLNRRFFTFHEQQRPYILLKWAQSLDGFMGLPGQKTTISGAASKTLLHKWRSEEQAIMVGTNTAREDDPELNVREWKGVNPTRIALDRSGKLSVSLRIFDRTQPTLVFTERITKSEKNLEFITIDFNGNIIPQIFSVLFSRGIQSVIIEGGPCLLTSFIKNGTWDEARIFISKKILSQGLKAPVIPGTCLSKDIAGEDELLIFQKIA